MMQHAVKRKKKPELREGLTNRQQREREFYTEYLSQTEPPIEVSFDPVLGTERRPWNSYWYVYEAVGNAYAAGARRLLDFGCGQGVSAIRFAYMGFEVSGFDITPSCVEAATRLGAAYRLSHRIRFSIQTAERVDYPDESFDVVAGIDILHHVEIPAAVAECLRVLKPGGMAIFREHVEAPVFDRVRNTRPLRALFPKEKCFDMYHHITEDERKLNANDLRAIRQLCPKTIEKRFYFLARLNRLARFSQAQSASRLEKIDSWLFKKMPPFNKFGGAIVMELRRS
jgi:2-polyprenyl-3-methyl-5-hydroxy-6-metoxy-1,4-benzoquinol methylase